MEIEDQNRDFSDEDFDQVQGQQKQNVGDDKIRWIATAKNKDGEEYPFVFAESCQRRQSFMKDVNKKLEENPDLRNYDLYAHKIVRSYEMPLVSKADFDL